MITRRRQFSVLIVTYPLWAFERFRSELRKKVYAWNRAAWVRWCGYIELSVCLTYFFIVCLILWVVLLEVEIRTNLQRVNPENQMRKRFAQWTVLYGIHTIMLEKYHLLNGHTKQSSGGYDGLGGTGCWNCQNRRRTVQCPLMSFKAD